MRRRVAIYAHHSGSGHLRHAHNVALTNRFEVAVLSTGRPVDESLVHYFPLTDDADPSYEQPIGAPFHYVPKSAAVQRRFAEISGALQEFAPDVVMVDVSAEVAAFARLSGYPTMVRRMHGDRTDRAHLNMYDLADGLFAYFPKELEGDNPWRHKTSYLGMVEPSLPGYAPQVIPNTVVVQTSLGGEGVSVAAIEEAARQCPGRRWQIVGIAAGRTDHPDLEVLGVVDDPASLLASAEVIITSTGHNAVRAAVAARRPLILAPEPRMYDEQLRFAEALAARSDAILLPPYPDWQRLLSEAAEQNPDRLRTSLFVSSAEFADRLDAAVEKALGKHSG